MSSMADAGSNKRISERFFKALRRLDGEAWAQIGESVATYATAFCGWGSDELKRVIEVQHRRGDERALEALAKESFELGDMQCVTAVVYAAMSLAYFDDVNDDYQLTAAYGPFMSTVKLREIDPDGTLPDVLEVPPEEWRRFLWRAFGLHDWDQPVTLGRAVQHAVGSNAVDAALNRGFSRLEAEDDEADRLATAIVHADEFKEHVGVGGLERSADLYEMLAKRVGNTSWAAARTAHDQSELQVYRLLVNRAAQALILRDYMEDQGFWLLYLPFVTTIPVHTLRVGATRQL